MQQPKAWSLEWQREKRKRKRKRKEKYEKRKENFANTEKMREKRY